jgi:hypothetical protein
VSWKKKQAFIVRKLEPARSAVGDKKLIHTEGKQHPESAVKMS